MRSLRHQITTQYNNNAKLKQEAMIMKKPGKNENLLYSILGDHREKSFRQKMSSLSKNKENKPVWQ